ncbi:MAG TPA: substrate-binding domain-containing protein [Thermomicrobiales bacterium]|nr:substrate-binding domain-containing protein [Thermomicrobiales bacterium]
MSEARWPLILLAPGSLSRVRAAVEARFAAAEPEIPIEFHPAAHSGVLARRILAGAPADVFISADPISMAPLVRGGLVSAPRTLAGNRLAVVVRREFAARIGGIEDLARDGVRLLLPPAAADPLGRYAEALFARAGLAARIERKRARGEIPHALAGWAEAA